MASYRRPLSKNELRQIRRQKTRIVAWCGVAVCCTLAAITGLLYLMYKMKPH